MKQLSDREREVVKHLLEGKSNKLIASALQISERTVEFHLTNIYAKFEVSSRTELVLKLGESTVADQAEFPDNRDRFNPKYWAASLKQAVSKLVEEFKMERSLSSDARSSDSTVSFFEAIRICLAKYADFTGRASRAEFWWFALFVGLVTSALVYVSEASGSIFLILILLPLLAAGARRLRDSGQNPWWLFFLLVPVGGIVVLGFMWAMPPASEEPDDTLLV